ncbi:MAG: cysteine hydrolase [Caldilineaceae bacterium]|nr:cysteine hydrolase [Caldilineaceae bacterium]
MAVPFIPAQQVDVPEINFQSAVTLPAAKTALVIVDMQNDFVKEGGSLVVPTAVETLPILQSLLGSARTVGMRVAYTQDTHFADDPEYKIWPPHCKQGTWGWEIVEELAPAAEDLICPKSRYDGFYGTWLEHHLKVWQVENLVIVGTVASICVLHTAASAGLRWYNVVVPADGVSALTEFDQALTLRQVSWLYTGMVTRSVADIEFVS